MLGLACDCTLYQVDPRIAEALPFVFYWGLLFVAWLLGSIPARALTRVHEGEPHPIGTLRYLVPIGVTAAMSGGLMGVLPVVLLLLPVFAHSAGRVLGGGLGGEGYRRALRVLLLVGLGLVPVAYLRVALTGALVFAAGPLAPLVCLAVLGLFFKIGQRKGVTQAREAQRWNDLRGRVASRRAQTISVQAQQGCPLCWETFSQDRQGELSVCWCCHTVTHSECLSEMGRCPTLGCASTGRRKKRRPQAPVAEVAGLCVKARAGEPVLAYS